MTTSANLGVTHMVANQDSAEVTVNNAINLLETFATHVVVDKDLTAAPGSPVDGTMYIVAGTPSDGIWDGENDNIALYYNGWYFITAGEGMTVDVIDEDVTYRYDGADWQVVTGGGALAKTDATVAPTPDDDTAAGYSVSSIWVDVTNDWVWQCVDATNAAAVWVLLSQGEVNAEGTPQVVLPNLSNIAAFAHTFAALASGTRRVDTINLGTRINKERQVIGFFTSSAVDAEIEAFTLDIAGQKDHLLMHNMTPDLDGLLSIYGPMRFGEAAFIVTKDYTKATRGWYWGTTGGSKESYGAEAAPTDWPGGWTYTDSGVNLLTGWYDGAAGHAGIFSIAGACVECESAWLEDSGSDTLLKIAIYNRSTSSTSSAKSIKIGAYE